MNVPTLGESKRGGHLYAMYNNRSVIVARVHARNRDQATRIAEKAGYEVGSVNMEG